MRDLTARHEATRAEPWSVDDAPADFVARMLRAIVGVELEVTRVEAKRKLSQNRTAEDVAGVVAALAAGTPRERRTADGDGRRHRAGRPVRDGDGAGQRACVEHQARRAAASDRPVAPVAARAHAGRATLGEGEGDARPCSGRGSSG